MSLPIDKLTVHTQQEDLVDGGKIVVITIDNPPVNAGSVDVRRDLLEAFTDLAAAKDLAGVILTGANGNFVAGSDIKEFSGTPLRPHLPEVIAAIEDLAVPVIALIDGAALGGGYELALGCDFRIATTRSVVGLPEVTLGLIPGAGGTFRLPRLIGIAETIKLVTTGRRVKANEALALGMIDLVTENDLMIEAIDLLKGGLEKRILRTLDVRADLEEAIVMAESIALKSARGAIAVGEAIAAIKACGAEPIAALEAERKTSLRLRKGPQAQALQHLFFAERTASRAPEGTSATRIEQVGVAGAGRMGTGIALAFASRGFKVVLAEQNTDVLVAAKAAIKEQSEQMQARGRISSASELSGRIAFGTLGTMADCGLVVEAITENMAAKKQLFTELDEIVDGNAVLASNTSYLDLDEIATAVKDPGRVAGLHFFNPANIMKLVEIVRAEHTRPQVVASLLGLCRKLGKVPVVARVGEGFIGNRIFAAYRAQCEFLLEEGCTPAEVDAAMRSFGMAMGPFAVFDLAGLDIAWAMRKRLAPTRPAEARYVTIADTLCAEGRFGRKTGKGWYDYTSGHLSEDQHVSDIVSAASAEKGIVRRSFSQAEIQNRLLSTIINEACWVLHESIAQQAGDIDLALVYGYGFPALKGGPLHWAARQPRADIIAEIDKMLLESGPTAHLAPNIEKVLEVAETI